MRSEFVRILMPFTESPSGALDDIGEMTQVFLPLFLLFVKGCVILFPNQSAVSQITKIAQCEALDVTEITKFGVVDSVRNSENL